MFVEINQGFIFCWFVANLYNNYIVASHLEAIERVKECNEREAFYVKAAKHFAAGDLVKCTDEFLALLREYPLGE